MTLAATRSAELLADPDYRALLEVSEVLAFDLAGAGQDKILWEPLPHQRFPTTDEWSIAGLIGGRGAGKTDACAAVLR